MKAQHFGTNLPAAVVAERIMRIVAAFIELLYFTIVVTDSFECKEKGRICDRAF